MSELGEEYRREIESLKSELERVRKERDDIGRDLLGTRVIVDQAQQDVIASLTARLAEVEKAKAALMQEVNDEAVETQEYFKKCNELEQQLREARENADRWNKEGIELARKMAEIAGLYHAAQRAIERKDRALISMRTYAESMKGGKGLIVESYFDFFERECAKAIPPIDPSFPKSTELDSTHGAKCKVPEPAESAERGKVCNCQEPAHVHVDHPGASLPEGRAGKENS